MMASIIISANCVEKNMAPCLHLKLTSITLCCVNHCHSVKFDARHFFLLLFYRYGENVVEVHHNTKWTCLLVGIFATTVLAAGEKVGCLLAKYTVG